MRLALLIAIIALSISNIQSATIPSVNPECQSLADIINDIKRRFDLIPLSLLPIPGLNASLPTTLKCHEYPSCTGFNCTGTVYGTHIHFSFNFDYCLKPISANISLSYPAENVTFVRKIQHATEFFITKFSFKVPVLGTNIDLPVQLYGKINMVRAPGKVIVSAGIIPKFNIIIPVALQPFNIITNQTILVDTSRCNATSGATAVPSTPGSTSQASSGTTGQSATTLLSTTPTTSTPGSSTTDVGASRVSVQATNQAIGSGPLSGGEIAAVVMGIVAFITIIVFVMLFLKRRTTNKNNLGMNTGNQLSSVKKSVSPESTYFGGDNIKASVTVESVESNPYAVYNDNANANTDSAHVTQDQQSTYFGGDNVKTSATVESNHHAVPNDNAIANVDQDQQNEAKANTGAEVIITSQFEVHKDNDKVNAANTESAEAFQF